MIQLHEREDGQKTKTLHYFIKDKEYDQSAYECYVLVSKTVIVAIITV